jgi:hypothetical protein
LEISVQVLPKLEALAKWNVAEFWTAVSVGIKDALELFLGKIAHTAPR